MSSVDRKVGIALESELDAIKVGIAGCETTRQHSHDNTELISATPGAPCGGDHAVGGGVLAGPLAANVVLDVNQVSLSDHSCFRRVLFPSHSCMQTPDLLHTNLLRHAPAVV